MINNSVEGSQYLPGKIDDVSCNVNKQIFDLEVSNLKVD